MVSKKKAVLFSKRGAERSREGVWCVLVVFIKYMRGMARGAGSRDSIADGGDELIEAKRVV